MDERKNTDNGQKFNIFIEDRAKITVTAVNDVDAFDETGFTVITSDGALCVKGADLHISKLNVETGELVADGEIDSCTFSGSYGGKSSGIFSKIFK